MELGSYFLNPKLLASLGTPWSFCLSVSSVSISVASRQRGCLGSDKGMHCSTQDHRECGVDNRVIYDPWRACAGEAPVHQKFDIKGRAIQGGCKSLHSLVPPLHPRMMTEDVPCRAILGLTSCSTEGVPCRVVLGLPVLLACDLHP